ncbi:MAG: MBL fold metallo-hydrolase [Pseudomonadota bacterium]
MTRNPIVQSFWDEPTGSWQYVFHDPATLKGAIVDPVWNFDANSATTDTQSAQAILDYVVETGIDVDWVLDTHPHADHFSAGPWLKQHLNAKTGIGENVTGVQRLWREIYHLGDALTCDGSQWDRLFADGERFRLGELDVDVLFSPGHTLASVSYIVGDAAFVHDTLMMPDCGSSRADFPGGSSADLYDSVQRILALPSDTKLYIGHDYRPGGRAPANCATVAEQKADNIHFKNDVSKLDYCALRDARDQTLPLPRLMLAALQVNIRGGRLPQPEADGKSYLKIPLNAFSTE